MGMRGPVQGVVTYTLTPEAGGTRLALSHRAVGDISDEDRASYTEGWGEVLAHLRNHIDVA